MKLRLDPYRSLHQFFHVDVLTNETVIAEVTCAGKRIVEFVTSSPIGLRKSAILNPSTGIFTVKDTLSHDYSSLFLYTGVYIIILTWTPTADQYGPQGFCAGAIDNTGVQSTPWCITFLVGFTAPNLQKPMFVQHSASPLGTILANHSIFSIQSMISRMIFLYPLRIDSLHLFSYRCEWCRSESTRT